MTTAVHGAAAAAAMLMLAASSAAQDQRLDEVRRRVAADYGRFALEVYTQAEAGGRALRDRIAELLAAPEAASLAAARKAWVAARQAYGMTEVLRFYDGPIDNARNGVETYVNAWPLDEAYVDYVRGDDGSGIINAVERYPQLGAQLLTLANERGGEANICLGWHAIEFLLWGQDLSPDGPGDRSADDFVVGRGRNAERRRTYLTLVADLLVEHLAAVRREWEPDRDNYRAVFEAAPKVAIERILTGMTVLSGFELSGERMAVAYETRDQEEEHSCFSDTTHLDLLANQRGIAAVYRGDGAGMTGHGMRALARLVDPQAAADLDRRIEHGLALLRAIPAPFDRAIRGTDDAAGRRAVLAAMQELEVQAESLASLGLALGIAVPLTPGGR